MGLQRKVRRLSSRAIGKIPSGWRVCRYEQLEPRQFLSAVPPVNIGAVYLEDSSIHDDVGGDLFEVTFNGGAPGTQLTRLEINTDQNGDGQLSAGDMFFHTAAGGPGVYGFAPLTIIDHTGFEVLGASVVNGGTSLAFDLRGFDPGEKLVFSIDVDEMQRTNSANAVVEGAEFEASKLIASFTAAHYYDADGTDLFLDFYDSKLAGTGLNLPPDNYNPPSQYMPAGAVADSIYTAGAVLTLQQEPLPISISGNVYEDLDMDNRQDSGEPGIGQVLLELQTLENGTYVSTGETTSTDSAGHYEFKNVLPGTYRIVETQPAGYLSVGAAAGTVNGQTRGVVTSVDIVSSINLDGGEDSIENDFGEVRPVSLSGHVFADLDDNGAYDAGSDPLLPGVTVELLDGSGNVVNTTVTDDLGEYAFIGMKPGVYGVHEVQPAGYLDGADYVGSAGGILSPPDSIVNVNLPSGANGVRYDFSEIPPASLSGRVFADLDGNNAYNAGTDRLLPGVTVQLLDDTGAVVAVTITGTQGEYGFTDLRPGVYRVHEVQPAGYLDGPDYVGSEGGELAPPDSIIDIKLPAGTDGLRYDFSEILPASISGHVFVDRNVNYLYDSGEPLLPGVTVYLLDEKGDRVASTTTDANGYYSFQNLVPGTYGVEEVQPAEYIDGQDFPGSEGGKNDGTDRIIDVPLGPGVNGVNYDFSEIVPAKISGYIFQDGPPIQVKSGDPVPDVPTVRTGVLKPGDVRLAGVQVYLVDDAGRPVLDAGGHAISTVTNADGYYEFTMLPPGTYAVVEVQPAGYEQGIDTAGSHGGVVFNKWSTPDLELLKIFDIDPQNDAIVRIAIEAGDSAENYNFSEVLVAQIPNPPPPPHFPPILEPPIPHPPLSPPGPQSPDYFPHWPGPATYVMPAAPLMFGGSGGVPGYTWHLSVIDDGQPRNEHGGSQAVVRKASELFDPATWSGVNLTQSRFVIFNAKGQRIRKIIFGMPGAIPITGDFNGDGKTEVGVFVNGEWFIDRNGDGVWDDEDLWASLGNAGDRPVTGDWNGDGKTDIGIFGPAWDGDLTALGSEPGLPDAQNRRTGTRPKNVPPQPGEATDGQRIMQRTAAGKLRADVIDHVFQYGQSGDVPVAGDWNGEGVTTLGVFHDGVWYLDVDGDGRWSAGDVVAQFGQKGDIPIVGDWTGDGITKIGVYRGGKWYLDTNNNHVLDAHDKVFELGGPNDVPVVGDFDGDGSIDFGVYQDGATDSPEPVMTPALDKAA